MTRPTALGLLVVAFAAGCSHSYRFEHTSKVEAARFPKLTGKTIALDLTGVPTTFETDANGHHFTIVDLRERTDDMVRRLLAKERVVTSGAPADVALKLALALEMGSTFTGVSCTAVARWDAAEKGRSASAEVKQSSSVGAIANGGRNCEIATINAVATALEASAAKL
jgi:hypothetical protein